MFDGIGIEPAWQALTLAVPIAVLLTLIAILLTRRQRRRQPQPLDTQSDATAHSHIMPVAAQVDLVKPPNAAPAPQPDVVVSLDVPSLKRSLAAVEASERVSELAPIYLAIARAHDRAGDTNAKLVALRSAAGLAARHGPLSAHAEARIELADIAYRAGDLTEACEQWQIARTALLADGQTGAHAEIDKTMRDHQCPTDWVLTDF